MARYHDVPDEMKITSEMILPAFGSIIARLWAQSEYMKETFGQASMQHCDALENLWYAVCTIQRLAGLCIDTPHASLLVMRHLREISTYIESQLGFSPSYDLDENPPFREYTKE